MWKAHTCFGKVCDELTGLFTGVHSLVGERRENQTMSYAEEKRKSVKAVKKAWQQTHFNERIHAGGRW